MNKVVLATTWCLEGNGNGYITCTAVGNSYVTSTEATAVIPAAAGGGAEAAGAASAVVHPGKAAATTWVRGRCIREEEGGRASGADGRK